MLTLMHYNMYRKILLNLALILPVISSCNNKEPYDPPYENIGGYVIGSEACSNNSQTDYWVLDFTVYDDSPKIGDTLVIDGITYTNVLKVRGLDERLQQPGVAVSIDYNKVSSTKVITTGCTISNPVTYNVKELFIINQGEIR